MAVTEKTKSTLAVASHQDTWSDMDRAALQSLCSHMDLVFARWEGILYQLEQNNLRLGQAKGPLYSAKERAELDALMRNLAQASSVLRGGRGKRVRKLYAALQAVLDAHDAFFRSDRLASR